jgi:uncharacterized protein (TIGR02594 family)
MLSLSRDIPWLEPALSQLGVTEIAGSEHSPHILLYHQHTTMGDWGKSRDETPWCASFVGWCLLQGNVEPSYSALARSYIGWGKACVNPSLGAVAVLKRRKKGTDSRTGSRGGYHVGFWMNASRKGYVLLSGNAADRVGIDWYSERRYELKAVRWPN